MSSRTLINISQVGENKGAPRIWFESNRLKALGFEPQSKMELTSIQNGIRLSSKVSGRRKVSSKCGVPVIDLNSNLALGPFDIGETVKVTSHFGRIDIVPTQRSFHIREANAAVDQFRVAEYFAGGGTFHDALQGLPQYKVTTAMELEARYLNVYNEKFPETATILQGDIRNFEPTDVNRHDIAILGIPCTDHSLQGRSKKGLKTPEDGEAGNLYMDVTPFLRHHRPLGIVIENVPSYLDSEAGTNLVRTLRQWGYSVTAQHVDPLDFGEITSRKRCLIVATLRGAFQIQAPTVKNQYRLSDFLDPVCPIQDKLDAERDAHSVRFLAERTRKMASKGNGWKHHIFPRDHLGPVPTITKGYQKRQTQSWMIKVPFGEGARMLRKEEIARIHGHSFPDEISTALACEMSGQGVMTRVFHEIFKELAHFLQCNAPIATKEEAEFKESNQGILNLFG